jgi:hypothetical protein
MGKVRWVKFKSYSGVKIAGTKDVPLPTTNLHMDRAYYLTAMLEAPKFGSVQSYDGAGMSGGPLHNIAVYPRNLKQGSLFPLLRRLEIGSASLPLEQLWSALKDQAWFVARDGLLRRTTDGTVVSGREIRNVFSPVNGRVPRRGPKREAAEQWALLFHNLLSHPSTFLAQKEFAIEYLIKSQSSVEELYYRSRDLHGLRAGFGISTRQDLALCVYHSFSVNGPSPAARSLQWTLNQTQHNTGLARFAPLLIWKLGTNRYGRWREARYSRTRIKAYQSGLWPREYFIGKNAIMPKTLGKRP